MYVYLLYVSNCRHTVGLDYPFHYTNTGGTARVPGAVQRQALLQCRAGRSASQPWAGISSKFSV